MSAASEERPGPLPERVLLVRLGAIGDVTNALLVAGAIRAQAPGTRIGWVVHELARPLVEGNPAVDRVHRWDKRAGFAGLRAVVREIRDARYDLAVDLQRIAKSAFLARASGARRVLGFDRARSKEGAWLLAKERTRPGRADDHVVEQYRDVIAALGLRPELPTHPLPSDPAATGRVQDLLSDWGGAPVLVNLGASKPENRWGGEAFAALARGLAERGRGPVVLTGGPDDRAIFAQTLEAVAGRDGVHDLVGRTNLLELAELARGARAMVSCDTGPMHLAAAVGCRVVALFGPANPDRTGPWGEGHRVLRAEPAGGLRAMSGLAVEPVLAAVESLLA